MSYRGYGAPFMPGWGNPYMAPQPSVQPLKSPDQFKAELMAQLKPQMDQYSAFYNQSQEQAKMQAGSGQYFKVSSYDEVKNVQAPADGKPVMIFDESAGRLYSKRFENGQAYITGFQLVPLEEAAEPKQAEAKPDPLQEILAKLNGMDERLTALEGNKNGADGLAAK